MENLKAYFLNIDLQLFDHVSGKPKEFVNLFREQHFLTEEAFAKTLCGAKYNKKYYSELRSRTLKILQALVIVSETKRDFLVNKNFYKCQKKFFLGQKLLMRGQRSEGIRVIKQAYQIAIDFDFVHIACELASILHHDHIYYNYDKRLAKYYANKVKYFLNSYSAEKEVEYYYFELIGKMRKPISVNILEETIENINRCKEETIKCQAYLAMVYTYHGLYTGKYEQLIIHSDHILEFFKSKKGAYRAHYLFFLRNRGTAQTALRKYHEAAESYQEAAQYAIKPYNVALLQFYKTLNALHAGWYEQAYELYQKNKRCKIEDIRQQFAIIEAYLCFLVHTGHLKINKIFRLGKYLNETFKAQQNKKVDNVNIIIAELLVLLVKNRGKFIDRIEAVQHYSYRHLKSKETRRARWFIKILCLMAHPKVNFHPVALERRAKQFIDLLKKHPARLGENFSGEVIPFEQLLEMILERVMRKVA